MRLLACGILVGFAWAAPHAEEALRVRAYLDPQEGVTDGRPIQLVIEIDGKPGSPLRAPTLPAMTNLRVVQGPSTSVNSSWINGRSSYKYQLLYTLLAERPGPAEVPAFTLEVDGTAYPLGPLRVRVGAAAQAG
ncbi:MAG TPA: BatD family protein, partial [Candidatus Polarisedimenticolaceae bacterium]|nr:BatD family protein [Candidatus Polarisedimenticolaceae bacterium]